MSIFRMDTVPLRQGETKTDVILQYLIAMRHELQYVLTHLDADNFSEKGLDELAAALRQREEEKQP